MNDAPSKFYFRQRQRNRLYDVVLSALEYASEHDNIRRKDIAKKLKVNTSQISRWLSGPANWETDTVSDLLFAVGAELDFKVVFVRDRARVKSNRFHPAGEVHQPSTNFAGSTTSLSFALERETLPSAVTSTSVPQPRAVWIYA